MATVRKAPSVEYNYQLVITRVFEEGEEDILEEEDESMFTTITHTLGGLMIFCRRR